MPENETYGAAEYLGHQLLLRHQEARGYISRSSFHKLWTITAHYLEENGHEVKLPYFWYKYGEMVDERSINAEFFYRTRAPWGGIVYNPVYEMPEVVFDVPEKVQIAIDKAVRWSVQRFRNWNAQRLKAYQYSRYAPNAFIQAYSELRDSLEYTDLEHQRILQGDLAAQTNEGAVLSLLDEMVIAYPEEKEQFETFQKQYLIWDDTARLLLEQTSDYDRLDEFLDEFVEALSRGVLQFVYNKHIPKEGINAWCESADEAIGEFDNSVDTTRREILENREPSGVLQELQESYDEQVISDMNEE